VLRRRAAVFRGRDPQRCDLYAGRDRAPALERMQSPEFDAAIAQIWTAPETLARVRDYVARTLRKS